MRRSPRVVQDHASRSVPISGWAGPPLRILLLGAGIYRTAILKDLDIGADVTVFGRRVANAAVKVLAVILMDKVTDPITSRL